MKRWTGAARLPPAITGSAFAKGDEGQYGHLATYGTPEPENSIAPAFHAGHFVAAFEGSINLRNK
jgi:hypothetical protein